MPKRYEAIRDKCLEKGGKAKACRPRPRRWRTAPEGGKPPMQAHKKKPRQRLRQMKEMNMEWKKRNP